MRPVRVLFLVVASAAALLAAGAVPAGAATTVMRLDGIGPLKLGMTRTAALATGWLANRQPGCELESPRPIDYRFSGPNAPRGLHGTADFQGGKLRALSFTGGARTATGVTVGRTTTARMVARYRSVGFAASAQFVSTFGGTFVRVRRRPGGADVIGGFARRRTGTVLAIPGVPGCEYGRSAAVDAGDHGLGPVDDRGGLDDVALHPELVRIEAEGEPEELREVEDRHVELAADRALGQRLLEVEVQVAQRARRHEAIRVRVDRVAEVAAGLAKRHLVVHRDDRDAAALVLALLLDHGAADRIDDLVQVDVARVACFDP